MVQNIYALRVDLTFFKVKIIQKLPNMNDEVR